MVVNLQKFVELTRKFDLQGEKVGLIDPPHIMKTVVEILTARHYPDVEMRTNILLGVFEQHYYSWPDDSFWALVFEAFFTGYFENGAAIALLIEKRLAQTDMKHSEWKLKASYPSLLTGMLRAYNDSRDYDGAFFKRFPEIFGRLVRSLAELDRFGGVSKEIMGQFSDAFCAFMKTALNHQERDFRAMYSELTAIETIQGSQQMLVAEISGRLTYRLEQLKSGSALKLLAKAHDKYLADRAQPTVSRVLGDTVG